MVWREVWLALYCCSDSGFNRYVYIWNTHYTGCAVIHAEGIGEVSPGVENSRERLMSKAGPAHPPIELATEAEQRMEYLAQACQVVASEMMPESLIPNSFCSLRAGSSSDRSTMPLS
jgi:hypothetical protein